MRHNKQSGQKSILLQVGFGIFVSFRMENHASQDRGDATIILLVSKSNTASSGVTKKTRRSVISA